MDKEELRKLEKQMDDYFENNSDEQVVEDIRKFGIQINNNIIDELENPANGIQLQQKTPPKRKKSKGYINCKK